MVPGASPSLSHLWGRQFVLGGQELNTHPLERSPSREPGFGPQL